MRFHSSRSTAGRGPFPASVAGMTFVTVVVPLDRPMPTSDYDVAVTAVHATTAAADKIQLHGVVARTESTVSVRVRNRDLTAADTSSSQVNVTAARR